MSLLPVSCLVTVCGVNRMFFLLWRERKVEHSPKCLQSACSTFLQQWLHNSYATVMQCLSNAYDYCGWPAVCSPIGALSLSWSLLHWASTRSPPGRSVSSVSPSVLEWHLKPREVFALSTHYLIIALRSAFPLPKATLNLTSAVCVLYDACYRAIVACIHACRNAYKHAETNAEKTLMRADISTCQRQSASLSMAAPVPCLWVWLQWNGLKQWFSSFIQPWELGMYPC